MSYHFAELQSATESHEPMGNQGDYVLFTPDVAFEAVTSAVETLRRDAFYSQGEIQLLVDELKELSARYDAMQAEASEAWRISRTDPTTLMLNARGMHEALGTLNPNKTHLLLMVDLGDFKNVNDTFGHKFGDDVLKWVGLGLASLVNPKKPEQSVRDNVSATGKKYTSRLHGDEFLQARELDDDTEILEAIANMTDGAHSLREIMMHVMPELKTCHSFNLAVGIIVYDPGLSIEDNLKRVDKKMYDDKELQRELYGYGRRQNDAASVNRPLNNIIEGTFEVLEETPLL